MSFSVFIRGVARRLAASFPILLSGLGAAEIAPVQEVPTELERIVVEGRAADLIGTARSASEGSVGSVELAARPFLRRGELLEVIPGVVITQHSGGGKANQYFLRGFNLDHGTDFAVTVEGMPVNMRSHAHGQGYADINFLIPEFVEGVDYRKGPYSSEVGDFSAAGSADYHLVRELSAPFFRLEAGEYGFWRAVAGGSFTTETGGSTLTGLEVERYDGPWELGDDFRRINLIARHTWSGGGGEFTATLLGYDAEWDATDQIPLRATEAGSLDRFGYVDPSNGGATSRVSLSLDGTWAGASGSTRLNLHALRYTLDLYSNFTYFLDDPVNGDQFNQRDGRWILGGSFERAWSSGEGEETVAGLQFRSDFVDELGLHRTRERGSVSTVRDDEVTESSLGLYVRKRLNLGESLRAEVGVRGDAYAFDVASDLAANSGNRTAGIVSPKAGLVYRWSDRTELYLNGGLGFHSNDARGTVISVDPISGDPADRVDPLVRSVGFEAGLRTSPAPGLVSTLSVWHLDLDSELVFVGDAGGTEASGKSRRYGVELANFYRLGSGLTLDADVAFTHARYRDAAPDDRIANSLDTVITAGATYNLAGGWLASVRLRYFGDQPLIEDDSIRAPSSTSLNGKVGYAGRDWDVTVEVLNILDRENNDIAYAYTSRLPGEDPDGVDDIHFHPAEPQSVRVSVTRRF